VAITFRFAADGPESVAFGLSPLAEAFLSLHALLHPKTHVQQHPWIREMQRLPQPVKQGVREFGFLYFDRLPAFAFAAAPGGATGFDEQLRIVEGLPGEEFARQAARDPLEPSEATELRRRLLEFLDAYWREGFEATWSELEPRLAETARWAEKTIAARGVLAFLEEQRQLTVEPEARKVIRRSERRHDVTIGPDNPLLLLPSAYVWPNLRVNCDPPWPTAMIFATEAPERSQPPDRLLETLRATADPTRLQILKLIAERPRSTEELAPLVGLSESGLSKQLRRLADVGLLEQRRDGYYVLYALERERLAALSGDLLDFLES
jgi:DNA-binding transcriptional ArsR family regulator